MYIIERSNGPYSLPSTEFSTKEKALEVLKKLKVKGVNANLIKKTGKSRQLIDTSKEIWVNGVL